MVRVLVIEDEQEVRANIRRFLQLEGYEVTEAENGRLGVEAAVSGTPDLILCDLMMPELDGFSVLRELRAHPATREVAFCFLSANAGRDARREGLELGADDYLAKPFALSELRELIDRLFSSGRMRPAD